LVLWRCTTIARSLSTTPPHLHSLALGPVVFTRRTERIIVWVSSVVADGRELSGEIGLMVDIPRDDG
jgi:hypothetical protein